jgi:RNA polymerase sigma factor (sigma-70 family)
MPDDPTIISLVTRARDGDKAAWDELVDRFAPLVWSICRRFRLAEADASDVGQTVWLYLIEQLPNLREPAALPGWLATTTRRECLRVTKLTRGREQREVSTDPELTVDAGADDVDKWLLEEERNAALRAAFAELPPRCQRLLSMLLQDPPAHYADVSAELGIAVGGIGPTRSRCLEKLRRSPALASYVEGTIGTAEGRVGHDCSMVER